MRIVILGDPIANMRHKSTLVNGKMWQYDSQKKLKHHVAQSMHQQAMGVHKPDKCAYKVTLEFNFEPPKSASAATKNLMLWGMIPNLSKKDWDNLSKFFCDCGNGILWPDDHLIVKGIGERKYSETACTIMEIEKVEAMKMSDKVDAVFKAFSPGDMRDMFFSMSDIFEEIHQEILPTENISQLMIDFANEWTDKLKKIKGK